MTPTQKLDLILRRHEELSARLAEGTDGASYVAASRELASLDEVVAAARAYRAAQDEVAGLNAMLAEPALDPEMRGLAETELREAERRLGKSDSKLRLALLPRDAADERGVILEVRAGTGGDEAALFAGDLFRMYQRYAETHGWKLDLLSASEGTAGGYKENGAGISGRGGFPRVKIQFRGRPLQRL